MTSNNQDDFDSYINNTFTVAKFFAILSVICAHITLKDCEPVSNLYMFLGRYGVITFYFLSGYFFHAVKYNKMLVFLKKKISTIIIPWVIAGAFLYFYSVILGSAKLGLLEMLLYIIGHKTLFYFNTCLLLLYVIYFYVDKKNYTWIMYISIILNIISQTLTSLHMLDFIFDSIVITKYFNIFNYIGWFSLGLLIKRVSKEKIYNFIKSFKYLIIALYAILVYMYFCNIPEVAYLYNLFNSVYKLFDLLVIISISSFAVFNNIVIKYISSISYSVYLYHLFFVAITYRFYAFSVYTKPFSALIVLASCTLVFYVGGLVFNKLKLGSLYLRITGIRGIVR